LNQKATQQKQKTKTKTKTKTKNKQKLVQCIPPLFLLLKQKTNKPLPINPTTIMFALRLGLTSSVQQITPLNSALSSGLHR